MDRRRIVEDLIGTVDWTESERGYCRCPGMELHTHRNAPRDCRVMIDRAPTIHCVHSSCSSAVADANHRLRSAVGKAERGHGTTQLVPRPVSPEEIARRRQAEEKRRLTERSRRSLEQIVANHQVEPAELFEESPVRLLDDPRDDWRLMLQLFPSEATVWIGDPKNSCDDTADEARKATCREHFRPVAVWLKASCAPAQFTCPSSFKPGVHSRSNANVMCRPFLVVESDTLGKPEMLAVFEWMRSFMRLRAVVDTGGKSLHGWFSYPDDAALAELRVILPALGFDEALFKASQPCRLPGAARGDKLQRLLWLDLEARA